MAVAGDQLYDSRQDVPPQIAMSAHTPRVPRAAMSAGRSDTLYSLRDPFSAMA